MEFPKRDLTHVMETASVRRLEQCLPARWIVRHVTERDYGVDCLVEPVAVSGAVQGELMALQVKSIDSIAWKEASSGAIDVASSVYSGISVTSVNYWMGLPVPVFLCVHERSTNGVYFAPVKLQVRRDYQLLRAQASFGFQLRRGLSLCADDGVAMLLAAYIQERAFSPFAMAAADLLSNRMHYVDYMEGNTCRDTFMEVETPELVTLFRLIRNTYSVVSYSGWAGTFPDVSAMIAEDQRQSGDRACLLHEWTHSKLLRELVPAFLEALRVGQRILTVEERAFWVEKEPLLVRFADQHFDGDWLQRSRERLAVI